MITFRPLPFFNERKLPISALVIHSMAHSAEEGLARLAELQLSAHYIVDYDGSICQCVSEDKRAWHAGLSYWQGITDINSCSIGIEVCHRTLGQSKFNRRQIQALIDLCSDIISRRQIAPTMIVGHSDIAPTRKPDPGKDFPWRELASHNIGIWYGSRFSACTDIAQMLSEIGYDTTDLPAAAYAFCRRFLPKKICRLPVRKILEHPYPNNSNALLSDAEFLQVLQNMHTQYLLYKR